MNNGEFEKGDVEVAFLWHMHQPYYKDESRDLYLLPWVRLHGVKDYYPMAALLEKYGRVRATFNFVPSLIEQINDYVHHNATDTFLELSKKKPCDLSFDERHAIVSNFFKVNYKRFVEPNQRYVDLLIKKGVNPTPQVMKKKVKEFTDQDILDLQVLFNLSWFHSISFDEDINLAGLKEKQAGYTEEDKRYCIQQQREVLSRILPLYKRLADSGRIELTCTPRYHPILPLLCDTDVAKVSLPGAPLPDKRFSHPEDAKEQIEQAIAYHTQQFGKRPHGMWPSEGSVSKQVLELLIGSGVSWIAADEDILFQTFTVHDRRKKPRGAPDRKVIYRPYTFHGSKGSIGVVFRDKNLSNFISFNYNSWDPSTAALDLMGHFYRIRDSMEETEERRIVAIVMDGENAWEYFEDNARKFFETLYAHLDADGPVRTTTISDYIKREKHTTEINAIYPGSWINHSFEIWIGSQQKNLAWEYLGKVRDDLVQIEKRALSRPDLHTHEALQKAWRELFIAEGSDWFWWYGDPLNTGGEDSFDGLFRLHLMNVYRAVGAEVPEYLKKSIA